jgi:hypothetical protein
MKGNPTVDIDDMIRRLRRASFPVYRCQRPAAETGFLLPRDVNPEQSTGEAWVDLGSVARGGDTAGQTSTVLRSNYRTLHREHPDLFTDLAYANVSNLGAFVADLTNELVATLVRLARIHLVFDEDDLSQLEDDEIGQAWEDYLRYDVRADLSEPEQDTLLAADPNAVRDAFYRALTTQDYYPEHTGLDIRWDHNQVLQATRHALNEVNHRP